MCSVTSHMLFWKWIMPTDPKPKVSDFVDKSEEEDDGVGGADGDADGNDDSEELVIYISYNKKLLFW